MIIAFKDDKKPSYTPSTSRTNYTYSNYDNMDDEGLLFHDNEDDYYDDEDDIHDTGEIFNRFQDGNCSKSDLEYMMEDDDIRAEFYGDY